VRPLLHLKAVHLQSKCWVMMSTITIYTFKTEELAYLLAVTDWENKMLGTSNNFDGENKMILQVLFLSRVQ
jgi:hypothetical protein